MKATIPWLEEAAAKREQAAREAELAANPEPVPVRPVLQICCGIPAGAGHGMDCATQDSYWRTHQVLAELERDRQRALREGRDG